MNSYIGTAVILLGLSACGQTDGGNGNPPPVGIPMPGANDTILLDLRQTLQQATSLTQAWALFPGNDHTPERGPRNDSGWSFTTNYDGAGTHALRSDWAADPGNSDQGIRIIHYLPSPYPKELYARWKNRTGKHPADPDANGSDNTYAVVPRSQACKRALFGHENDQRRVDFTLHRESPETAKLEIDDQNYPVYTDAAVWNFDQTIGKDPFTYTVYLKAASSNTVADGVFRLWVDGTLVIDQSDVPSGSDPFFSWQFPATCTNVAIPSADYFWDFLVWKPGA